MKHITALADSVCVQKGRVTSKSGARIGTSFKKTAAFFFPHAELKLPPCALEKMPKKTDPK